MMKNGKSLERLVECLENILISNENIVISSPYKLSDRVTGEQRESSMSLSKLKMDITKL